MSLTQDLQESKTSTIILDDDDPSTVQRMLTYLYTSDYYDGSPKNSDESEDDDVDSSIVSGLMANVLVYALAEKHNIEELKLLAFDKFWRLSNAFALPEGFPAVVDAVYTTNPDRDRDIGMRRVIVEKCSEEIEAIAEDEDLFRMFQQNGRAWTCGAADSLHKDPSLRALYDLCTMAQEGSFSSKERVLP